MVIGVTLRLRLGVCVCGWGGKAGTSRPTQASSPTLTPHPLPLTPNP